MNTNQPITIKPYVTPLDSIARSDGDTVLGSALSQVNSSHEPVFVYDSADTFLGLISPFQAIFSSNYPYTTKVSSISFVPPKITYETPVYQAAEFMLAAKVYALPVTNKDGEMDGLIRAVNILDEIKTNTSLLEFVSGHVTPHTPITAPVSSHVKDVFHDLKERGVSRMILTDEAGALAGIVTRGDMMDAMTKPTDKERFANEGTGAGQRSLAGEKRYRQEEPVTQYSTTIVDTLPEDTPTAEIVKHLITSEHDSVVLTNTVNKPTGFLSTRDLLLALTKLRSEDSIHITLKKPGAAVSDKELEEATDYLDHFAKKLHARMNIGKIEVTSQEPKNVAGKTKKFNIKLIVTPVAGKSLVAEAKDRDYVDGIREAAGMIEKQERRSGLSKG